MMVVDSGGTLSAVAAGKFGLLAVPVTDAFAVFVHM